MTTTAKRQSLLAVGLFFAVLFYVPFLILSLTFPNPAWLTILGSVTLVIGIYFGWRLRSEYSWLALAVAVGWAVAISAIGSVAKEHPESKELVGKGIAAWPPAGVAPQLPWDVF